MARLRRIAVLRVSKHDVLRGILAFAAERGDWLVQAHGNTDAEYRRIARAGYDGVIGWSETRAQVRLLRGLAVPRVTLSDTYDDIGVPKVGLDNHAIGEAAARHLLALDLPAFATIADSRRHYGTARVAGFRAALARSRRPVRDFAAEHPRLPFPDAPDGIAGRALGAWLRALPTPVGLFATTDEIAWIANMLLRDAGRAVPDEVALLGVDDDEALCAASIPPLSSVRVPWPELGRRAAELLQRLLDGRQPPRRVLRLPPMGVTARASTSPLRSQDAAVERALALMREQGALRLGVPALARAAQLPRRTFERRFRRATGRTPLQAIHAARLSAARRMLRDSELPLPEVASRSGYGSVEGFHLAFRRALGLSPGRWRRDARRGLLQG